MTYELVRNCVLPLDLYYKIEDHLWVRPEPEGRVTVGFTDVAQTTAGAILHVTFKEVGKFYPRGKVVALVESAKWLGPLRAPVSGTLVSVNEALLEDAGLINRSPYRRGWVVQLAPSALEEDLRRLLRGPEAVAAYERLMAEKDLDDCVHCEGFEI